jgi:hypothetical protein
MGWQWGEWGLLNTPWNKPLVAAGPPMSDFKLSEVDEQVASANLVVRAFPRQMSEIDTHCRSAFPAES